MRIKKLRLKNFRNIAEAELSFHGNFTVYIGKNGTGKSTVLAALKVACGGVLLGVADAQTRNIKPEEIRLAKVRDLVAQQKPVVVQVEEWDWLGIPQKENNLFSEQIEGDKSGIIQHYTYRREIPEKGEKTTSSKEHVGVARAKGEELTQKINKELQENVECPVIAYFGTARLHGSGQNREVGKAILQRQALKLGYENWAEMKSSSYKYAGWLRGLNPKIYPFHKEYYQGFFETIKLAIPQITDVRLEYGELLITTSLEGSPNIELGLDYLSDGMRTMFEMVAELTYRCFILNGHFGINAPQRSFGVVGIDEIDMHLHPEWQLHVVKNLRAAFPNIQFIVTTHSPLIIGSVDPECIRILKPSNTESGIEVIIPAFSKGAKASEIITIVQGSNSDRDPEIESLLNEIEGLIDNNQFSEADGKLLSLYQLLNNNHIPDLIRLKAYLSASRAFAE